ncbi:MAG: four helix bundle protein [Bacteroidetes bacterium]|nr:four helix bundle protein [Bacteroidota bacterium]
MNEQTTPPERKYDLEPRLIEFASLVIDVVERLPKNIAAKHLGGQLVRSGTSPALNYGEAQGAESKSDFIHKMGIVLKELWETRVNLKIIQNRSYIEASLMEKITDENSQLVAIISKSVKTAKDNLNR